MYTLDRVAPVPPTITSRPRPRTGSPRPSGRSSSSPTRPVSARSTGRRGRRARRPSAPTCRPPPTGSTPSPYGPSTRPATSVRRRTSGFVLDRTAPSMPVITGGPAPFSDDDTPSWTFTVDADADRLVPRRRRPLDPVRRVAHRRPGRGVRRDPLARGEGDRRRRQRGARGRSPRSSSIARRPTPPPSPRVPLTPGNDPTPRVVRSPTSRARPRGARSTAATPIECDGTATLELLTDGVYEVVVVVVDAAGNTSDPDHQRVRARHASHPPRPWSPPPRTPDRDVHPEWGIEVEPGAVAECSLRRRRAGGLRRDLHRRPRRPRRHPPPVGRRPRRRRERLRPGHQHLRARHHRPGGAGAPPHPRPVGVELAVQHRDGRHRRVLRRRRAMDALRQPPARAGCPDARCASRSAPSIALATAPPSPARPSRRRWRPRSSPLPRPPLPSTPPDDPDVDPGRRHRHRRDQPEWRRPAPAGQHARAARSVRG